MDFPTFNDPIQATANDVETVNHLIKLCSEYKQYLEYLSDTTSKVNLLHEKFTILDAMLTQLHNKQIPNAKRLENLGNMLSRQNRDVLRERSDSSTGARFLENVLLIGNYPKSLTNTFAFWKSPDEVFVDKINEEQEKNIK